MRTVWLSLAFLLAALPGASILLAEDKPEAKPPAASVNLGGVTPRIIITEEEEEELTGLPDASTAGDKGPRDAKPAAAKPFVVTCKLKQPNEEARLFVAAVAAGKQTEIPVRFRAKFADGKGAIEADKLEIVAPGAGDGANLTLGHKIQVKADSTEPNKIRLAASVQYSGADRTKPGEFHVIGHTGTFVGELAVGKPALVVLETDDRGQPKHWVELVVRFADEQADEKARELSETYPVVYSVAGLVGVAKRAKPGKRPELDFAPLIKKLETKVAPKTWAGAGGEGKIQSFARTASLVVTQTSAVHKELAAFLERLIDDEEAIQQAAFEN
jgi:hypothetical protein